MSKAFDEYISDKPEINIISKEDLISNQTGMKVYIDLVDEKNHRIIIYSPQLEKLETAILADRN